MTLLDAETLGEIPLSAVQVYVPLSLYVTRDTLKRDPYTRITSPSLVQCIVGSGTPVALQNN